LAPVQRGSVEHPARIDEHVAARQHEEALFDPRVDLKLANAAQVEAAADGVRLRESWTLEEEIAAICALRGRIERTAPDVDSAWQAVPRIDVHVRRNDRTRGGKAWDVQRTLRQAHHDRRAGAFGAGSDKQNTNALRVVRLEAHRARRAKLD